jgi:hypothetical protein
MIRRALLLAAAAATLALVATASAAWRPADGAYEGPYMGCVHVHFAFFEQQGAGRVLRFHTNCSQQNQPAQYTHYFQEVRLHDYKFSWTSPENPNIQVEGRFTGTRSAVGTIRDRHGVVHHWEASKQ